MIKGFEGYYPPDFEKLWKEATFVFDTNVLLDLYRSSPKSRREMIDILEKLDGRIWIPHQFFYEYHKNKATIYDSINSDYETWETQLQDYRAAAINGLQQELAKIKNRTGLEIDPRDEQVASIFADILRDLAESKEQHQSSLNNEPPEKKIAQLFAESYGEPCEDSCLENIRKLAKERLEKGIPPGSSKDSKKKNDSDPDGDLIGWLQTIKFASVGKKPIILVSNDGDWFLTYKGKTKGPYPALLQEMYDKAQVGCYIYKSSQFIKHAQDFVDAKVSEETIEENENREKYFAEQERRAKKALLEQMRQAMDPYLDQERRAREAFLEQERQAIEPYLDQERRAREAFLEQERQAMEPYLDQERRAREAFLEQERQAMEPYLDQERRAREAFLEQERRATKRYLDEQRRSADNS